MILGVNQTEGPRPLDQWALLESSINGTEPGSFSKMKAGNVTETEARSLEKRPCPYQTAACPYRRLNARGFPDPNYNGIYVEMIHITVTGSPVYKNKNRPWVCIWKTHPYLWEPANWWAGWCSRAGVNGGYAYLKVDQDPSCPQNILGGKWKRGGRDLPAIVGGFYD